MKKTRTKNKINKKTLIIIGGCVGVLIIGIVLTVLLLNKPSENSEEPKKQNTNEPLKKVTIVDLKSKSRPYAVMINNLAEARQVQSGLSEAYMVYEIIVEGGITRFLALYQDAETAKIGSVRSARHYYLDYVLENDAIFVHWGYSDQAKSDIKTLKINNINGLTYEGVYFYRDNPLKIAYEHTGFTNMEMLKEATKKLKYRQETDSGLLLSYSADPVNLQKYGNELEATDVTLTYSKYIKNQYKYDDESKLYKRFVNGKEHNDFAASEQLMVKNIIVYEVENYTIAGDTKGRQFLENIGSGEGYFITEGKAIKITWKKDDRSSRTKYFYENGTELIVNDGNTFIQIMPKTGSMEMK